jgi:hypothetical protein
VSATTEQVAACLTEASNAPGEPCVLEVEHSGKHRDAEGFTWYTNGHKHGRPDIYEITWMSGHIERIAAHQVSYPEAGLAVARSLFNVAAEGGAPRVQMHAEIDGQWRLVLAAREEDIRTMRMVTDAEPLPRAQS